VCVRLDAFPGISHGDLLKLVFSVAILLAAARLFGELARRLRQPPVVGEILAGVILGPSLLSGILPGFGAWLLPQTELQSQLLDSAALIGILFLMIVVGLETDLSLIRARWRAAAGVGFGGLVVPFAFGFVAALIAPQSLLAGEDRMVFALFLAVALALSAIPVLAKILSDLRLLKREFGQTALAAGMIDDITGWALLGMVISLASAGVLTVGAVAGTIGAIGLFFVATFLLARPVRWVLGFIIDHSESRDMALTFVVALAFGWGAFSQWLHLEPILGAFAVGVLFGQVRQLPVDVTHKLESITNGVFAPIFLATAGLRLRIDQLLEPRLLIMTLLLFLVAAAGKLGGGYLGARLLAGTPAREALGYGIALNARGVLGIVVATVGLSMGIFGVEVYSMVVVTSLLTSVMAPVGLKLVFGEEEEEAPEDTSLVFRRALLPLRLRASGGHELRSLEASALAATGEPGAQVTLLSVVDQEESAAADSYLKLVAEAFPRELTMKRRVMKGDPVRVILDEAAKGFDLIALGATETGPGEETLFGNVIDEVVRLAPCPSVVFTARGDRWPPRTIMVPTGGSRAAARAAAFAFALAGPDTTVLLVHIVDPESGSESGIGRSSSPSVRMGIGHEIVTELRHSGEKAGVPVVSEVIMGGAMTTSLVDRAGRGVDLIVLGTSVRVGTQRLFLGPRVERLIREAPCSVVVLNT
jgi:Kef-type K+ transport system membrane component KefB